MPTVVIPAEHFTKNAKRNYSDIDTALIREFIQNSIDARATRIDLKIDETSLQCIDNGHGMTRERMVEALLTLSGTYKKEGSIGGFGSAKEAILFQHDHYTIHSLDTKVEGKVLQYEFIENPSRLDGTDIKIWFHANYKYDFAKFLFKAKEYLKSCAPETEIYLNGEKFTDFHTCGDLVRETDWGRIYVKKDGVGSSYVSVRIKGVTMFQEYVGAGMASKEVIIEITKPSIVILTANRDNFQYEFRPELSKMMNEIIIDKESFGRCYQTKNTYRGRQPNYDDIEGTIVKKMEEKLEELRSSGEITIVKNEVTTEAKEKARQVMETIRGAHGQAAAAAAMQSALQLVGFPEWKAKQEANMLISSLLADFIIYVKDKGYDKVPEYLEPEKMGKRWKALARLWKRVVKNALQVNGMKLPYTVGWILEEGTAASYIAPDKNDGVHAFLLNPLCEQASDANHRRKFMWMLTKAVHEATHVHHGYHDESFQNKYEEMLNVVLANLDSWWNEYLAAKNEVL